MPFQFLRFIVAAFGVLGVYLLSTGIIDYDMLPYQEAGPSVGKVFVGVMLSFASLCHIVGIRYAPDGIMLRENLFGRMMRSGTGREIRHCELYVTNLALGILFGVLSIIALCYGPIGKSVFKATELSPLKLLATIALSVVAMLVVMIAIAFVSHLFETLSQKSKRIMLYSTSAAVGIIAGIAFARSSTTIVELLQMTAILAAILLVLGVITAPFWLHAVIERFFPDAYRRICPVVEQPTAPTIAH